ncbi:uncharacterized protein B0H18DRAFT_1124550 [Fomitopsis serialis]|uniref:uncharacterized protein n=1 Tax=Fomitopsis serialis TaxID=139415 RepID=UPI002007ACC0|nr:uncharacterized protein B0H18DRAFT_1124550 [Neoantrodia serialis]KAH9916009.1 hypothetical protein B0H18DRAFT_1124550 [Neoantrodia serialis]
MASTQSLNPPPGSSNEKAPEFTPSSSEAPQDAVDVTPDRPAEETWEDIPEEIISLSIRTRVRLTDNDLKVMPSETLRLQQEQNATKEKIRDNGEKITQDKVLPYLVANIVEILDVNSETEDGSANRDLDSMRKGRFAVIKPSTQQTVFFPLTDLVPPENLRPGDPVGTNKDSYLKQIEGLIEAIVLLVERADGLKAPGIKPPKGSLMYGPPGRVDKCRLGLDIVWFVPLDRIEFVMKATIFKSFCNRHNAAMAQASISPPTRVPPWPAPSPARPPAGFGTNVSMKPEVLPTSHVAHEEESFGNHLRVRIPQIVLAAMTHRKLYGIDSADGAVNGGRWRCAAGRCLVGMTLFHVDALAGEHARGVLVSADGFDIIAWPVIEVYLLRSGSQEPVVMLDERTSIFETEEIKEASVNSSHPSSPFVDSTDKHITNITWTFGFAPGEDNLSIGTLHPSARFQVQLVLTVAGLALAIVITKFMVRKERLRERWYD